MEPSYDFLTPEILTLRVMYTKPSVTHWLQFRMLSTDIGFPGNYAIKFLLWYVFLPVSQSLVVMLFLVTTIFDGSEK